MGLHNILFVPMARIEAAGRLRDVDQAWVAALAASIEANGLEQPIIVRPINEEQDGQTYALVAGGHRYAAVEALGWQDIPCIIRDVDEDQARLIEIDENLMRRELNALDRAVFLLERKTVHERLNPDAKHGGDRKTIKSQTLRLGSPRFTQEVAEKIGLSERAVQIAVQIATNLDKEAISHLRGTSFADNQNALIKLSNEIPARQRTLALQIRDGKARTLDAARIAAGFDDNVPAEELDPQGRYLATLMATWVKADAKTRARFLAEVKLADEAAATSKPAGKKGGAK